MLGRRVDPDTDRVAVDGVPVATDTSLVHWLLNKPADFVTTASDPQGRRTVLELVPDTPRTFPVGRLDRDTEGLLILTNDGALAQLLTHPSHGVEKEYLAEVDGIPTAGEVRRLREGVELEDGPTRPARVRMVQEASDGQRSLVEIVVKEGRKRMVRRMCRAVGHPVHRLVRTRIGPLSDRSLAPGGVAGAHCPRGAVVVRRRSRRSRRSQRLTSSPVGVLALRGAITVDDDSKAEVDTKTKRLVQEMLDRNGVSHDDLISIIFTATDDITAEFPATAARSLGLGDIPLICARELGIVHGKPLCIRVLMHFNGEGTRVCSITCTSKARRRCATTSRSSGRCASQWSVPASSEDRSGSP